jgi:6-phosphofructokinase
MSADIKRVGMLFSGGPAPAADAVISAAAGAFMAAGVEVVGFYDGYQHLEGYDSSAPLVEGVDFFRFTPDLLVGLRSRQDIILRTARANPGKAVKSIEDLKDPDKNAKLLNVFAAFEDLGIDALVSLGGDDTLKTANFVARIQDVVPGLRKVAVVHLPKTIDNDYYGIDWTFGFMTAADFAAREVRNIMADARSMNTWWILEIMGRKAGWLTYAAGIGGEATRIMAREDFDGVFDADTVAAEIVELMLERQAKGMGYGVICLAEGLAEILPEDQRPKELDEHGNPVLRDVQIGQYLGDAIEAGYLARTGKKQRVRAKQIGYETRCAVPGTGDILLGSALGVGACRALIDERLSGVMVSTDGQLDLRFVPFSELIDPETMLTRIRLIERDSDFYRLARAVEYRPAGPPAD